LPRTSSSPGAGWWWGALTAAGSGEQVVPASDYRALQSQVRELQRLLGKNFGGERDERRGRISALQ
jgi:hypothetical protein